MTNKVSNHVPAPSMLTPNERQQIKDILWRLDEEATTLCSETMRRTGAAWKAFVEHENHRRYLLHARNSARALHERLDAVIDEVDSMLYGDEVEDEPA